MILAKRDSNCCAYVQIESKIDEVRTLINPTVEWGLKVIHTMLRALLLLQRDNWCHASCFAEGLPIKKVTTCYRCKEIITLD